MLRILKHRHESRSMAKSKKVLQLTVQTLVDLYPEKSLDNKINFKPNVANIKEAKLKHNLKMKMTLTLAKKNMCNICLILVGYLTCYYQVSILLLTVLTLSFVVLTLNYYQKRVSEEIKIKAKACSSTKQDLEKVFLEIPSWVKFPDKERALWLNQVIAQLWPSVNIYINRTIRKTLETQIKRKYASFHFERVDIGSDPPKIDGIKIYPPSLDQHKSIIIDFDVYYDGNCDITCSISGAQMGGIKDFQMSAAARIVLKPILMELPIIGGIQLFFLNTPQINFSFEGLSNIPGLSHFIRLKLEEQLQKKMVFPNKVTKRFSKKVQPIELKKLEPSGVLRVHLVEGRDLIAKDITGKSDPYAVMIVGAQFHRSNIVKQNLNPKWDYWCEFVIGDPLAQKIVINLFDHDNVNEDDFLGKGVVQISSIIKGKTDRWLNLLDVKRGKIRLRFTWMTLRLDINLLKIALEETKLLKVDNMSVATLTVFIESIKNIPWDKDTLPPSTYFQVFVYKNQEQKSKIRRRTISPVWEQGFVFLLSDPTNDSLQINVFEKETKQKVINFIYNLSDLLTQSCLEVSRTEIDLNDHECKLTMSLQLRILGQGPYEENDEEDFLTDSDSEDEISLSSSSRGSNIEEMCSQAVSSVQNVAVSASLDSLQNFNLGKIELTLSYSEIRQKFSITVHQIMNLPQSYPDIPDPYVKVQLEPQGNITYRTKKMVDNVNPVYNETFEYLLSSSDLPDQILIVQVKTSKLFSNKTMGQIKIELRDTDFSLPLTKWFNLSPKKKINKKE